MEMEPMSSPKDRDCMPGFLRLCFFSLYHQLIQAQDSCLTRPPWKRFDLADGHDNTIYVTSVSPKKEAGMKRVLTLVLVLLLIAVGFGFAQKVTFAYMPGIEDPFMRMIEKGAAAKAKELGATLIVGEYPESLGPGNPGADPGGPGGPGRVQLPHRGADVPGSPDRAPEEDQRQGHPHDHHRHLHRGRRLLQGVGLLLPPGLHRHGQRAGRLRGRQDAWPS